MKNHTRNVPRLVTALTASLHDTEQRIIDHHDDIEAWLNQQWQLSPPPFYGSVDLRNAGFKLAPVGTNLFPAGFNNIATDLHHYASDAAKVTLSQLQPDAKHILIIPENHTRNRHYLDSLHTLATLIANAGFNVRIGSIDDTMTTAVTHTLSNGDSLTVHPTQQHDNQLISDDFVADCIILNNDLSAGIPIALQAINQPILPAPELGWNKRLKSEHFGYYRQVADEFGQFIDIDPWLIAPLFDHCPEVDFVSRGGLDCLTRSAELLFYQVKQKYQMHDIDADPFLVVKADQGTYGMAVMMINSPDDIQQLNRKQRTRMNASKGGRQVTRAIIQEGVPSFERVGHNSVAEPVLYHMGQHVIGSFYRIHNDKGPSDNLNTPGMHFSPLPICPPERIDTAEARRFYPYSVVSRLAVLAAARELAAFQRSQS